MNDALTDALTNLHDRLAEARKSLADARAHAVYQIWQERPGEISWGCLCGFLTKHQPLDEGHGVFVPPCPDANTARRDTDTGWAD